MQDELIEKVEKLSIRENDILVVYCTQAESYEQIERAVNGLHAWLTSKGQKTVPCIIMDSATIITGIESVSVDKLIKILSESVLDSLDHAAGKELIKTLIEYHDKRVTETILKIME